MSLSQNWQYCKIAAAHEKWIAIFPFCKKNKENSIFTISEGQDPEGPPYIQYEEILPTKESNALLGGVLTVDENRADVPAKSDQQQNPIYDYDDLDENMLLNLEGIGVFGTDFSKKVEEEITEEPKVVLDVDNPEQQEVQQRFFESGMRAQESGPYFQRNQPIRRRFRPR